MRTYLYLIVRFAGRVRVMVHLGKSALLVVSSGPRSGSQPPRDA